jgi:hypothetical protein
MLAIRKIAVILILIGFSIPIISALFCSDYSQSADLMVNVQRMNLVLKKKTEPIFKETLLDDAGIFKSLKYRYKWPSNSKGLQLISENISKNYEYDLIEVNLEGHGLVIYFPTDMSLSKIADAIDRYYRSPHFPAPIPEKMKPEHSNLFTRAVRFSGYRELGDDWMIPYRLLLAVGFIMVFTGFAILLLKKKSN